MIEITPEQLTQCTQFFTDGSVPQWIGGGLTVGIFLFTAFTKHSIPSVVKVAAGAFMKKEEPAQEKKL